MDKVRFEEKLKRKYHTAVYEVSCNSIALKRVIPDDGVFIYEIGATYAKSLPPSRYYVYGKTEREAKKRFKDAYSWSKMQVKTIRIVDDKDELEEILNNPWKRLII